MNTLYRHLIILMALLGWAQLAFAQEQAPLASWNGTQTSGDYVLDHDVTLPGTVTLTGDLKLTVGTGSVQNNSTPYHEKGYYIRRGNFNGDMFYIKGTGSTSAGIYTLTIIGSSTDTVYIDGGAVYATPGDARDGLSTHPTNNTKNYGACIEANQWGELVLSNVVVQNAAVNKEGVYGTGGVAVSAIELQSGGDNTTIPNFSMTDCIIRAIYCDAESPAIMYRENRHRGNLLRTKIYRCFGNYGMIRSVGATKGMLTIDNCQIYENKSRGGAGAIAWYAGGATDAELIVQGNSKIHHNVAGGSGGAMVLGSKVSVTSAEVYNNTSLGNGGGIYLYTYTGYRPYNGQGIKFTMDANVSIHDNTAVLGGGIFIDMYASRFLGFGTDDQPLSVALTKCMVTIKDGGQVYGNKAQRGGGMYVNDCLPYKFQNPQNGVWSNEYQREVLVEGGVIHDNVAYADAGNYYGGGIFVSKNSGGYDYFGPGAGTLNVTLKGGNIYSNYAKKVEGSKTDNQNGYGGAICVYDAFTTENSTCNILISGDVNLYKNESSKDGGGLYLYSARTTGTGDLVVEMNGGTIGSLTANNGNKAITGNGGGFCVEKGTVSVKGGTIANNEAGGNGGGFYSNPGSGKTTYINSTIATTNINNNEAANGAGVYVASGGLEVGSAATCIHDNEASADGGGIYANGGTVTVNAGSASAEILKQNSATNGGALYSNGGTVSFSNGTIKDNYASEKGGGIYIPSTGSLELTGETTLTGNHVPYGGLGGGVYLEGYLQVGETGGSKTGGSDIKVASNYADVAGATITNLNRNNIYLPNPVVDPTYHRDVITVVDGGLDLDNSSIGFSVPDNFVPVIYCDNAGYLNPTIKNSSAIFEDSHSYQKYYTDGTDGYDANHIYLVADTWTFYQKTAPTGFSTTSIDSSEDLAWFISMVNGLNEQPAYNYSGQTVTLTADIDMSAHKWVPIGDADHKFAGTFDGGGHTITGIRCNYIKGTGGTGTSLGLFGVTDGATIHDVFLANDSLMVRDQSDGTYYMGAIVGSNNGTIYNCIAAPAMETTIASATMGGLVGTHTGGTIHSSAAMPDMKGYTMGGLVGTLTSGNLYNSFANPKFTYSGSDVSYFAGGLVAVNSGTVQNCYVRFTRASSLGSAKFGRLAGSAGSALISQCYTPASNSNVPAAIQHTGTVSSCDTYGNVVAPYSYYHSNDNLVGSTTVTLCNKLNDWVTINNSTLPTCAEWKRTTAGGTAYSATAGDINGDYPIHEYSGYTCVASTDGINLDYHTSLDNMLARHVSDATINLYANEANVTGSTGTNVVVYIDENISLLQDVSGSKSRTSAIEAYTCQTLPGDPRSWHFISSSLSNSGIGFEYNQYAGFNWEPNPCHVNISENNDASLFPSDLPKVGGFSDVSRIDLYTFYEPEYHWINLKRNSASHWHMNATTTPINYTNETTLTPGKGYLVSIDQDQLLQNRGTLNNGDVEVALGYSSHQEWAGLVGYNLLGNPYQSYLSFTAFVDQNSTLWYDDSKGKAVEPTYAVYDDAMGGYIQYKQGASRGARTASGTLNMHQGFMVRSSGATRAKFTNAMRTNDGTSTGIREEQPAFPLINLTVTDSEGVNDFAVLELGRDADEGAQKLRANDSKGWLYLHHGSDDYGILFRSEVDDYQPLWFEAEEAGTYTLSWGTANAEFESLTLVDNITGVTTDMLATDSYVFKANPDQYKSRFKIVVGDYKDTEENTDGPSTGSEPFAYINIGNIVIDVEACHGVSLQIVDMLGRVIVTHNGPIQCVPTNGMASGVYILRLTDNNGTRTQKLVIE